MSAENVGIVRRLYEAWSRSDFSTALELIDPEIEVEYHGVMIDKEANYRGHAGVRELLASTYENFEKYHVEIEQYIDRGDQVVASLHQRAAGTQSGVPVEVRNAHVWTLRDGKAVRWRICRSKAEALDAVGLTE